MKARRQALALAVILVGAVIAYDAYVARRTFASRAESAALAQRYAQVLQQLRPLGWLASHTGQDVAGHEGDKAVGAAGPGTGHADAAKSKPNYRQLIASDPVLLKQYLRNFAAGIDVEYGMFIRLAGLSPADASQFKQLMAEIEANNLQVAKTAAEEGLSTTDPQMKALQTQLNQQDWIARADLLGPSAMAAFDQYRNEGPVVTLVQDFGGSLGDTTLNDDQTRQLLSILSNASARNPNGGVVADTVNVQQAMAASSSILNPNQALVLSAMLQESEAKAKLSQLSPGP